MKRKSLRFREIEIKRMPGFKGEFFALKDLKPGVNIIYGPNATGKTTLAKGFQTLLWPEKSADRVALSGDFTVGKKEWKVEVDYGRVEYRQGGISQSINLLPSFEIGSRYYLALDDLLQKKRDGQSFAELILKESAGGYQISDAVEELNFKEDPARKNKLTKKAEAKMDKFNQVCKELEGLEREEKRLVDLNERLEEIRTAVKDIEVVQQVIEFSKTEGESIALQNQFGQFSPKLSLFVGDEEKRLKEIKEGLRQEEEKIGLAQNKLRTAQKTLEEFSFNSKLKEEFFVTLKGKRDRLKAKEEEIDKLGDHLRGAEKRMEEAEKNFIGSFNGDKLSQIDTLAYDQLSDFARRSQEVEGRFMALNALKRLLNPQEELAQGKNDIRRGVGYLEDYLLLYPEVQSGAKNSKLSLLSGLIISFSSILMGTMINPILFILLLIGGGIIWYGRSGDKEAQSLEEIEEKFSLLEVKGPKRWDRREVKVCLSRLYALEAETKRVQKGKDLWAEREEEYRSLVDERNLIEEERDRLIDLFGVAPHTGEQTLYYLTYNLNRWQDAYREVNSLLSRINGSERNYRALLEEINRLLGDYKYREAFDAAEINGIITDLQERNKLFIEADRDKQDAQQRISEANIRVRGLNEKEKDLFDKLDLEVGAEVELKRLGEQLGDYLKVKSERESAEAICESERAKAEAYTDFNPSLLDCDLAELNDRRRELKIKAGEYDKVQGEIKEIQTRVATAKEGNSVEKALAQKERALDRLEGSLQEDYSRLCGYILANEIKRVDSPQNSSKVFNRAQDIFSRVTQYKYELRVRGTEPPSFRAFDTVQNQEKKLEEISSGTRLQLLLAVRIAFIDIQEGGVTLPIYLDETLANADEKRAEAIIKTVIELAKEGRQCFYFTAQKDEVGKWISSLDRESMEANLIQLTREEGVKKFDFDRDELGIDKIIPAIKGVPSSTGLSDLEYKEKISIDDFNPRQGARAVHLWYLIEEPKLLEELLVLGIHNWGQLKTLLTGDKSSCDFLEGAELLDGVEEKGRLVEEIVNSLKQGIGKLVDREALLDSGAVSDSFIDKLSKLTEEVGGEGEVIIERLAQRALSGFRTNKIDQLEDYFKEEGYIVREGLLPKEELRSRLIAIAKGDSGEERAQKVDSLLARLTKL